MLKKKSVLFDRDGTLIVDKVYLNDPEQVEYYPDVFEALPVLRDAGYVFAVATNQSGIPRGLVDPKNLLAIHQRMQADFANHDIEFLDFYYAPYMTDSDHWMRKPNPGMLELAAKDHNLDLKASWMVGNRMSDVEAGHRAGCRSVFLTTTNDSPQHERWKAPEIISSNLLKAAHCILEWQQP